jgi:predicted DNA-binding ArsR family transcriptional regulator
MLTLSQVILVVVITVLCVLVIVFSIYIFKLLDELKTSLQKINLMLDDLKRVTKSVADPVEHASEFICGLKKGAKIIELAGELIHKKDKDGTEQV